MSITVNIVSLVFSFYKKCFIQIKQVIQSIFDKKIFFSYIRIIMQIYSIIKSMM